MVKLPEIDHSHYSEEVVVHALADLIAKSQNLRSVDLSHKDLSAGFLA